MTLVLLILLSYLLGSIPFALIIGKSFFNQDIRTMGSGNLGTTNMIRNLGKKAGFLVFFLDFGKGLLSLLIANKILGNVTYLTIFGAIAMLGHIFPIFANFKGGKAVATGFSILVYCYPYLALALFLIFFAIIFITGYVSLASITASAMGAIYILIFGLGLDRYIMVTMCILVIYMHKKNILRLIKGTESVSRLKIKK